MSKNEIDKVDLNHYWSLVNNVYHTYPTIKHRIRFILNTINKHIKKANFSVFDFGTGDGTLLETIKKTFNLQDSNIGGCDISSNAIDLTKSKIQSPYIFNESFPKLNKKFDVIVSCEVIEHSTNYIHILEWIKQNIAKDGILILTTQSGELYASDKYVGHTQHFDLKELCTTLQRLGFKINESSLWGFPFFTLQKFLTNFNFKLIKNIYLEGNPNWHRRLIFSLAYYIYFIHDLIKHGPQIFIVASERHHD